jgi:hypothetical protein
VLEIPVPEQFKGCWLGQFQTAANDHINGIEMRSETRYLQVCFQDHSWSVTETTPHDPTVPVENFVAKHFVTHMDAHSLTYRTVAVGSENDPGHVLFAIPTTFRVSHTMEANSTCNLTDADVFECYGTGIQYWNWNGQQLSKPGWERFRLVKEQQS